MLRPTFIACRAPPADQKGPRLLAAAEPLAHRGGRIDIDLEGRRGAALQIVGEVLAALAPQPMRETMRLDSVEALEVEQRIDEARRCGIAIIHRNKVSANRVADVGLVTQRI